MHLNTNTSLHMGAAPNYQCVDRNKCKNKYIHLNKNTNTYKLQMVAAPNYHYLLNYLVQISTKNTNVHYQRIKSVDCNTPNLL